MEVGSCLTDGGGRKEAFMPDLHSLLKPPYIFLILGVISFSAAAVSTCTGKTWARFQGCIDRAKEPNDFWWVVAIYYLGSVFFIGMFFYEVT